MRREFLGERVVMCCKEHPTLDFLYQVTKNLILNDKFQRNELHVFVDQQV